MTNPTIPASGVAREARMEAAILRALDSLCGDYAAMAADLRESLKPSAPASGAQPPVAQSQASNIAPGIMRCAKCKFKLHRVTLYMGNGAVGAGDSKTEPCPNGCGPLWPVTWEEEAREGYATSEQMFERAHAAETALAELQERLGPRVAAQAQEPAEGFYPDGLMWDAFGNPRIRYVRVIFDGSTCVVRPQDVAENLVGLTEGQYELKDVFLSQEEYDLLPEFTGF